MAKNLARMRRNMGQTWMDWYKSLPKYTRTMKVRCPTKNADGSEISKDDVRGCGSTNVVYGEGVYDCNRCGIFFSDYAANPPHRR